MNMAKTAARGSFIVFEGIDGSGKSTQLRLLINRLTAMGISFCATREPTDAPIGSLIHQIMTGRIKTDNKALAALFVADRLDHLLNELDGLKAKVDGGTTVLSDRYYFSSYAYHSVDMPMDWVIAANAPCAELLRPTVTVFIDIDPDISLGRINANRDHSELFETRERLVTVRENYFKAFEKLSNEEHVVVIDGNRPQSEVEADVWNRLKEYFV